MPPEGRRDREIEPSCCDDCNEDVIEDGNHCTNSSGDPLCDSCAENYVECNCGESVHEQDVNEFDGEYFCEGCYDEAVMCCPSCDYEMHRDDAQWSDRYGDYLCDSCYEEEEYNRQPDWEVYNHSYVVNRTDWVHPEGHFYNKDTFRWIKSKRYVGLELETNFRYDVSFAEISDDLNYELGRTRDTENTDNFYALGQSSFIHDGSVTSSRHQYGGELVMRPRRGDRLLHDADFFCKRLESKWDAYPSWKTGLHLHIDVQDYDWIHASVLTLFTKLMEPHIYTWLPKSRFYGNGGQRWGRPVSQAVNDFKYISDRDSFVEFYYDNGGYTDEKYNDKRYHGLNWHSHFQANQGLEIRYHSGTLQRDKIKYWTKFWTQVVDRSYEIAEDIRDNMSSYSNLGNTDTFKSLWVPSTINTKLSQISNRYSDFTDIGDSSDLSDYRKKSELLRRYLGLPKKDRPYLLQPMVYYLRHRANRCVMSLDNIYELFDIDVDTRFYFKDRKEQLYNSMEEHVATRFYDDVFSGVNSVVEFDRDTLTFEYKDIFKDTFLLVNDDRYQEWRQIHDQKQIVDYGLLCTYSDGNTTL
jgi:hypothetical protein